MRRSTPSPFGRFFAPVGLLPHLIDCYRREDFVEDSGSRVPRLIGDCAPILRDVPCWVQPANPQQLLEAQRLDLIITHSVTFYQDPRVSNGDYFLFRGRRILVIQGVNDSQELGLVWVATAREIG